MGDGGGDAVGDHHRAADGGAQRHDEAAEVDHQEAAQKCAAQDDPHRLQVGVEGGAAREAVMDHLPGDRAAQAGADDKEEVSLDGAHQQDAEHGSDEHARAEEDVGIDAGLDQVGDDDAERAAGAGADDAAHDGDAGPVQQPAEQPDHQAADEIRPLDGFRRHGGIVHHGAPMRK